MYNPSLPFGKRLKRIANWSLINGIMVTLMLWGALGDSLGAARVFVFLSWFSSSLA